MSLLAEDFKRGLCQPAHDRHNGRHVRDEADHQRYSKCDYRAEPLRDHTLDHARDHHMYLMGGSQPD